MHDIPPLIASVETLKEIAELSSYTLKVPKRAVEKGSPKNSDGELNPNYTATWTDKLEIESCQIVMSDHANHKGEVEARIRFRIGDFIPDNENLGRPFSMRYFIAPDELQSGRPESSRKKMTFISCGHLNQLLRASGWTDIGGTDIDYRQYFAGDAPTAKGAIIHAVIKHHVAGGRPYDEVLEYKSPVA